MDALVHQALKYQVVCFLGAVSAKMKYCAMLEETEGTIMDVLGALPWVAWKKFHLRFLPLSI